MPAIGTITLQDAAVTPLNHDFIPKQVNGDLASYENQEGEIPAGYKQIGLSLRDPSSTSAVYRAKISFTFPSLRTDTDQGGHDHVTVDNVIRANLDVIIPATSLLQARKDFRKELYQLLNHAQVTSLLEQLQHIY